MFFNVFVEEWIGWEKLEGQAVEFQSPSYRKIRGNHQITDYSAHVIAIWPISSISARISAIHEMTSQLKSCLEVLKSKVDKTLSQPACMMNRQSRVDSKLKSGYELIIS